MIKKLIAIGLIVSYVVGTTNLHASEVSCPSTVSLLDQGQPSPCRGYLFSPDKELELFKINEDYKLLKEIDLLKDKKIVFLQEQLKDVEQSYTYQKQETTLYQTQANTYALKYEQDKSDQSLRDALFYGGGVVTTVIMVLLVNFINK